MNFAQDTDPEMQTFNRVSSMDMPKVNGFATCWIKLIKGKGMPFV